MKTSPLSKLIEQVKPRRFHCYCVGAAKTGTTSLASSFSKSYRAGHEPETRDTNRFIIDYLEKKIGRKDVQRKLLKRDRRLRLELESAHPLGYLPGVLVDTFPRARFIVTVREPLSWLRSRLNYHHKKQPLQWAEYRDYFWTRRHERFAPEEAPLQHYNLWSLDTYLSQYADHYQRVLSEIPEDRRMVVLTSEIVGKLPAIASFVGANPEKVEPSHTNRSDDKITPLHDMDDAFINKKILEHCGELILNYFPDRMDFYTATS